jgi:hypothetical protein
MSILQLSSKSCDKILQHQRQLAVPPADTDFKQYKYNHKFVSYRLHEQKKNANNRNILCIIYIPQKMKNIQRNTETPNLQAISWG